MIVPKVNKNNNNNNNNNNDNERIPSNTGFTMKLAHSDGQACI